MDITTRRYQLTPEIREHAEKRVQKLNRYFDHIQEVHVVLAQEKHRQIAEVTVSASGAELTSREESHDMVSSIDKVVERLEKQIKKFNARLKDRKDRRTVASGVPVEEEELPEVEPEDAFSPVVVRGRQYHGQPATVEEAIRVLRENEHEFLLFTNSKTGKVSLVHIRPDGNIGLVEAD